MNVSKFSEHTQTKRLGTVLIRELSEVMMDFIARFFLACSRTVSGLLSDRKVTKFLI